MWVDVYIRERDFSVKVDLENPSVSVSRFILLPWLPEEIKYDNGGGKFATYDILDKGDVAVPVGENLGRYSWEGIFPGKNRNDLNLLRGIYMNPSHYLKILEAWKKEGTPLKLVVLGTSINVDVLLDDFQGMYKGGFMDYEYSISLIEDKDIVVKTTEVKKPQTQRAETQSSQKMYTVKKGDSLWEIAEKYLSSGLDWKSIYSLNKDIIETTAKKRGMKSSDSGWGIFPGTKLRIK